MGKCIQLPFQEPLVSSYHYAIVSQLSFAKMEDPEVPFINQAIKLECSSRFINGYTGFPMGLGNIKPEHFSHLFCRKIDLKYSYWDCKDIIKDMLNDSLYVWIDQIDDYCIPGKCWYNIKHRIHDVIITGYDEDDNTFTIVSYNTQWILQSFRVPQTSIEDSIIEGLKQKANPCLIGIELARNKVSVDIRVVQKGLKSFLRIDEKYTPQYVGRVEGIAVYDYLVSYFKKIIGNEIPHEKLDWRVMRVIWDFRKCMLKRIEAIEKLGEFDDSLSKKYSSLVEETNKLRILYVFYQQRKNDKTLESIINGILDTKDKEKEIIEEVLSKMDKRWP